VIEPTLVNDPHLPYTLCFLEDSKLVVSLHSNNNLSVHVLIFLPSSSSFITLRCSRQKPRS